MIKYLLKSLREFKKPTIITFIFMMGEALIETVIPFLIAILINRIETNSPIMELVKLGVILIVMALVSLGCGGAAGFSSAKASAGFAKNLREDIFEKIQKFSFNNIDKFATSSLVTRLTTDVQNVQLAFMMIIRIAIRSPLMLVFAVVMAYMMGGILATAFVVVIPVLAFGLILIGKKALPAFHSVFYKYDKLNESIEENIQGMRVVKGFSREEYEKEKFEKAADGICMDFTKAERIIALNTPLMQLCMYFNIAFVLFVGSKLIIADGVIGVGQISAMLNYGMQILMALMMLSMVYVMITMSAESAKRICEVLREEVSMKEKEDGVCEVANGDIDFDNVSFKYSENAKAYSLEKIDIHIKTGMTVGIIGGTGSGKSSLVQLIPRLYDVTEGTVKVAGIDVRDYKIEDLRNAVSMVLQKNQLFSGTIKENLRWGNENATDEELEEACKLAQAHDFIESFPEQYNTYIEQGGTNVSGGQKQRLCIARALLKKPKILILDDSTSAVDTKTDALIRKGFKEFIPTTTKIIIAQRIASVEDADLIIIMDNGMIVEKGTHEELLASSRIYQEIYEQQMKGGEADE